MPTREIIQKTQAALQGVCDEAHAALAPLSEPILTEMTHEAEDVQRRSGGLERLAAEIVNVEAQVVLDERKGKT